MARTRTTPPQAAGRRQRAIGPAGTAARIAAGLTIAGIMTWVALTGTPPPRAAGRRERAIGPAGTAARIAAGLAIAGIMTWVALTGPVSPVSWLLGLVGFPAVVLAGQWLRARRNPAPLHACGLVGHAGGAVVSLALLLTPLYAPPLAVTTNATAVFYGVSMLVAAVRGYAGCEVLAVSNWLLRRDDQIGCVLFAPVDGPEHRTGRADNEPAAGT